MSFTRDSGYRESNASAERTRSIRRPSRERQSVLPQGGNDGSLCRLPVGAAREPSSHQELTLDAVNPVDHAVVEERSPCRADIHRFSPHSELTRECAAYDGGPSNAEPIPGCASTPLPTYPQAAVRVRLERRRFGRLGAQGRANGQAPLPGCRRSASLNPPRLRPACTRRGGVRMRPSMG